MVLKPVLIYPFLQHNTAGTRIVGHAARLSRPEKVLVSLWAMSLLVVCFLLRPKPGTNANRNELLNHIGRGISVLIEVQSPYGWQSRY